MERITRDNLQVGLSVVYIPDHAKGDKSHKDSEKGTVHSWNDRLVFVEYPHGVNPTPYHLLYKN